jgi:hypothetical protein
LENNFFQFDYLFGCLSWNKNLCYKLDKSNYFDFKNCFERIDVFQCIINFIWSENYFNNIDFKMVFPVINLFAIYHNQQLKIW